MEGNGRDANGEGKGGMARKPVSERNAEQKVRQAELRRRNRALRRPTRDDVARVLLFKAITDVDTPEKRALWETLEGKLIDMLVEQGFDGRESERVLDDLYERYTTGRGGFRRKLHLEDGQAE